MKVYRVETEAGRGPYRGWLFNETYLDTWTDPLRDHCTGVHVPPDQDLLMGHWYYDNNSEQFVYGVRSMADVKRWFNNYERRKLTKHGFRVTVWRAPYAVIGVHQLAFDRAKSTLLEVLPL